MHTCSFSRVTAYRRVITKTYRDTFEYFSEQLRRMCRSVMIKAHLQSRLCFVFYAESFLLQRCAQSMSYASALMHHGRIAKAIKTAVHCMRRNSRSSSVNAVVSAPLVENLVLAAMIGCWLRCMQYAQFYVLCVSFFRKNSGVGNVIRVKFHWWQ
jgi:hypothetical protein